MAKKMYRVSIDVYVEANSAEEAKEMGINDLKRELNEYNASNVEVEDASHMAHVNMK